MQNKIDTHKHRNYYNAAMKYTIIILLLNLLNPVWGAIDIPGERTPVKTELIVTDKLNSSEKELTVETDEWKVCFSLFYNGGIYRLFDKVHDPAQTDNLVTGPDYCQGGIFDYDIYLLGSQEFMTTIGKNNSVGRATLEILENTPVRLRLRQFCHPRLNNGDGPPTDQFIEFDMVEATTEWTIYPTGRVNIKFDTEVADDWDGIVSKGPGDGDKSINTSGTTITAANGTNFLNPWITRGDTIESTSGGWGPIQITDRASQTTITVETSVGSASNLDFIIRRPYVTEETISIHADGDTGPESTSYWQGGSNGDTVYDNGGYGDKFRNSSPPVVKDYCYAHWTRPPRGHGSMLAFNEDYTNADFAVFNDQSWDDISYTQVGRYERFVYQEHHRHFMAHLGTENGKVLPRIKSVADALPLADDYKNPYAVAHTGILLSGDGISTCGFHVPTGAYHIAADNNKTAAILFDAGRGGTFESPLAYMQPAVLVFGIDIADDKLLVDLSKDTGGTFEELPQSWYNITTRAQSSELGAADRRLLQLFCTIPATATGEHAWVLRLRERP